MASACKNHQRAKWAILGLFVVTVTSSLLMKMDRWSYFVMAVVVAVSLAIGHWLGPSGAEERTIPTMESAARHLGLAMTIAALNFRPGQLYDTHSIPDRLHGCHHGLFAMA